MGLIVKMENTEIFRRKFLELEQLTIHEEDKDEKLALKIKGLRNRHREPYYSQYDFIDFCRECRNRISHDGYENDFIFYGEDMIKKLDEIIEEIKHPYKVYDKATKNIFSAKLNDNVRETMQEMMEKNYTHIPIYNNNKLVGIFSERVLFNYLYENKIIEIDDNTLFSEIEDFISLNNSKEIIKFADRNRLYDDVCLEFINEFKKGSKLSCVLVTQNGKEDEKIIGILTAWDILGR